VRACERAQPESCSFLNRTYTRMYFSPEQTVAGAAVRYFQHAQTQTRSYLNAYCIHIHTADVTVWAIGVMPYRRV
jgi:hypothetical protein